MNKLMYRFVVTTKKKKKEIDPFLDTICPFRVSRVKKTLIIKIASFDFISNVPSYQVKIRIIKKKLIK